MMNNCFILDVDDGEKHNIRTHLCLNIQYNGKNVLIPLRKNLGDEVRPFGRIGLILWLTLESQV